ncbi:MAG: carbohydrate ABC transporter permease [Planktomarina sp.]
MNNVLKTGLLAAFIGAGWAVTIAITVAMTLSLAFGQGLSPQLGAYAIGGAIAAVAGMTSLKMALGRAWVVPTLIGGLVVLLASLGAPMGLKAGGALAGSGFVLVIFLCGITAHLTFDTLSFETSNRFTREHALMRFFRGFGMVFFAVIVALPLFVLLMTSFKSQQALLLNPLDLSPDLSEGATSMFRSYVELFRDFNFGTYLWNSTLVSVLTVCITLALAVPGAYAVSRLNFSGRKALSRSILMIYLVPAIVLVIPLYAIFSQLGLRDSLWGLLVVYPATTLPVALYMLQGYFRGVPKELEEAGLMDGCSRLRVIWSITLPLALPALASVGLYVFMIAWNEFLFAFMFLDDPNMFTLSRGVVSLNNSEVPRQHLMAGAVVSTVPIVIIFLYAERFMVQGLTAGGVKG